MSDDDETPQRMREASPDEDRLIRYLSRVAGQVLMQAWSGLPPEMKDGFDMSLAMCAALTHNLGQLLAAAPKEGIALDDPRWQQFVETTAEMVRINANEARHRVLTRDQGMPSGATLVEGGEAPRTLQIAQPKFVM